MIQGAPSIPRNLWTGTSTSKKQRKNEGSRRKEERSQKNNGSRKQEKNEGEKKKCRISFTDPHKVIFRRRQRPLLLAHQRALSS